MVDLRNFKEGWEVLKQPNDLFLDNMNINFTLKNKNIILTGAAGILGQKLSQAYLDAGANLALLDINKNELDKLQKSSIKKIITFIHIMLILQRRTY